MPHRGASSLAKQDKSGSACPAWSKCQQKQHGFYACVYWFSTAVSTLSTVSANEDQKCLVKSGKDTVVLTFQRRYTYFAREVYLLWRGKYIFSEITCFTVWLTMTDFTSRIFLFTALLHILCNVFLSSFTVLFCCFWFSSRVHGWQIWIRLAMLGFSEYYFGV